MRQEQIRAAQRRRRRRNQVILAASIALLVAVVAFLASRGGDDGTDVATDDNSTSTTVEGKAVKAECPKEDGSSPQALKFEGGPPPMCIDPAKTYVAKVKTTEGDFEIALDTKKTPKTANNFAFLSRWHYYDDTTITRIDNSIEILQTGSPHTETISDPGPGYNIEDEGTGFTYSEGDVVMARSQGPNSGSAQYFLVYGPKAAALNSQGNYVTFGKVSGDGLAVLKKIGAMYEPCPPNEQGCLGGRPNKTVTITSITIEEKAA